MRKKYLVVACALAFAGAGLAHADQTSDALNSMKKQIEELQGQIKKLEQQAKEQQAAKAPAAGPAAGAKPDSPMHWSVGGTDVQLYGHLDLSVDESTKGISGRNNPAGPGMPSGRVGWLPAISSNLSYFGIRGNREIGDGLKMVFQIETQVDVAATPGVSINNASDDFGVKAALGSRNSYVGLAGSWGAFKLGKTDAPYKTSTARMDPFSATVGDYNSIMGNTGGDNRAEFDTRISHAMWYESPKWSGFSFNALFSPGQNRGSGNRINASGEPDCTGGNTNFTCDDGAFNNAYSASVIYQSGGLYVIGAGEFHSEVNRTVDEVQNGGGAGGFAAPQTSIGIANETAWKTGLQYKFAQTDTTINLIYERMIRHAPDFRFNERDRNGFWLALTQKVTPVDDLNFGWAHAGNTPGDVGTNRADGTSNVGPVANQANMYTLSYKHHFNDKKSTLYVVYARQVNQNGAHYDLGASGHGITTDCHDGAPPNNIPGMGGGAACFAGSTLQAVSAGFTTNF